MVVAGNLYTWQFGNAMGFPNKYLLGSPKPNIITGRALAKSKHVRRGQLEGPRVRAGGQLAAPFPPLATPMART